jgi:hypothetical protein
MRICCTVVLPVPGIVLFKIVGIPLNVRVRREAGFYFKLPRCRPHRVCPIQYGRPCVSSGPHVMVYIWYQVLVIWYICSKSTTGVELKTAHNTTAHNTTAHSKWRLHLKIVLVITSCIGSVCLIFQDAGTSLKAASTFTTDFH